MRSVPLLIALLVSCGAAFASDPVEEFNEICTQIQKEIRTQFYEATAFPDSSLARDLPDTIHAVAGRLKALPDPPGIPKIIGADKHRRLAYLCLAEARIYGALADSARPPNGDRFIAQRTSLARTALTELSEAKKWLRIAEDNSDSEYFPELGTAIEKSRIKPHIYNLEATAYSILWVLEKNKADKAAARTAWSQIQDVKFQSDFREPAPEVAETLDINPDKRNLGGMTAVSWAGIVLLLVGLVAAIFVSNASAFQQWAVRVIIAIGAAMTATVIPGLLNINIPTYVAAGGALAVIVLIYLFNPPKIEH